MKAMVLAAGLGTRLKPWTLHHPKALVPVEGIPMLERVINKLKSEGFDDITVNVHHFSDQIVKFLLDKDWDCVINISDESGELLDTGGGILKASGYFENEPVLVHNVDILSNIPLRSLMDAHIESNNDITLLTSDRNSTRKLIFDNENKLCGWHNLAEDEYRPTDFSYKEEMVEEAFSGIYVIGKAARDAMRDYATDLKTNKFPVMDFFLSFPENIRISKYHAANPIILDIGKPQTLAQAAELLKLIER